MKLRFNITFTILDEISRFKVHYNQHGKIYPKHIMISRMVEFEFQPSKRCRIGFAVFRPCDVETVALQCSSR
jgi:hypothetical protein